MAVFSTKDWADEFEWEQVPMCILFVWYIHDMPGSVWTYVLFQQHEKGESVAAQEEQMKSQGLSSWPDLPLQVLFIAFSLQQQKTTAAVAITASIYKPY